MTDHVRHIVPVGDVIEHDTTENCVCGPRLEMVGTLGWVYVHNSLDGREDTELGRVWVEP